MREILQVITYFLFLSIFQCYVKDVFEYLESYFLLQNPITETKNGSKKYNRDGKDNKSIKKNSRNAYLQT